MNDIMILSGAGLMVGGASWIDPAFGVMLTGLLVMLAGLVRARLE